MAFIHTARAFARRSKSRWIRYKYLTNDIAKQKKALASYSTGITDVIDCEPLSSKVYAAFVYYEQQEFVSASVQRIITSLRDHDVNVMIMCNHELAPKQLEFFKGMTHSIILRNNQGFDFGAFKDAVKHLRDGDFEVDRLLIMNDSVFYSSVGLDSLVSHLLGIEDAISAYENWGEDHHMQSFAMSLSSEILESEPFNNFWNSYIPVNNRVHAIDSGEKVLSRAVLEAARTSRVIYNASELEAALLEQPEEFGERLIVFAQPWRGHIEAMDRSEMPWAAQVNKFIDFVNVTSPIHSGAYLFPKFLQSPIYKKDIVYRSRFQFWEVQSWIQGLMPEEEIEEYLDILRKKGDPSGLSGEDKYRYSVGSK